MELLSPAGGMEQLKAALRFGADGVYFGLKKYGLRASAGNFDPEEARQAARLCHRQGARCYVTLNLLPFDRDMEGFLETARQAEEAGVDGAIVSDLGAALMLHEELPALPLHISTQANVLNSRTAEHFHQVTGASRIVLSREMSLEDIREMRSRLSPEVELEAFVHGAMCVAYSGRCLLSAALLGRSGNRGACAQPCRWQYHLMEEKRPGEYFPVLEEDRGTYLFSSWDLCMLPYLRELRQAGVKSLKIEGRMKTAYYVASVTYAYRRALDLLENQGEESYLSAVPGLMEELNKASHRVSNTGFYFGSPTPPAGAEGFTQTMEFVGEILEGADETGLATFRLKNRFYVGDELEVLKPSGPESFTVTRLLEGETGQELSTASVAGQVLKTPIPFPVEPGDLLRGPNRNHRTENQGRQSHAGIR